MTHFPSGQTWLPRRKWGEHQGMRVNVLTCLITGQDCLSIETQKPGPVNDFRFSNFKISERKSLARLTSWIMLFHKNLNLNKDCGVKFGLKLTVYFCVHSKVKSFTLLLIGYQFLYLSLNLKQTKLFLACKSCDALLYNFRTAVMVPSGCFAWSELCEWVCVWSQSRI